MNKILTLVALMLAVGCEPPNSEPRKPIYCRKGDMYVPEENKVCGQYPRIDAGWTNKVSEQTGRVYCVCEGQK